jgi:hypothetical protein
MADRKHSEDPTNAGPVLTDLLLSLNATPENRNIPISALRTLIQRSVLLDTGGGFSKVTGQLSYDPVTKTILGDTGFDNVRVNMGQELQIRFFNDTGGPIPNGTPINARGVDTVNNVVKGEVLDASSPITSSVPIGLATHEVADQTVGVSTLIGEVRDVNTGGLTEGGVLYAGTAGVLTQDFQTYPSRVVIIGTVVESDALNGVVLVNASAFTRGTGGKSYSFTQANVGAGTYYSGGFYDAPETDQTLNQVTPSASLGLDANHAHCSHAFVVCGGTGVVDTGQVGLRVTGVSINDDGVLTPADEEVLTDDITTTVLNQYLETTKKWVGDPVFELYEVVATITTYNLTFNWGLAKYEDLGNLDFTITGLEVVGTCGATDRNFDMTLLLHTSTGWTYSAGSFSPEPEVIADFSDDLAPYDDLIVNQPFAWKRTNLLQFVEGSAIEGILFRIVPNQTNSVTSMDLHISGVIEELIF